jgi:multidrug efflux pump subunit AcrB
MPYAVLAILGGRGRSMALGRAEDPIKRTIVEIDWPGASAAEIAREVTDRIERRHAVDWCCEAQGAIGGAVTDACSDL